MCSAPSSRNDPPNWDWAASTPPYISPSWLTWERASTCVPTWPPVTMISFAAEPPSARTMSPCRRISVIRNPGWFGEHGIPVKNGWPSSTRRTPALTASSSGSDVVVT